MKQLTRVEMKNIFGGDSSVPTTCDSCTSSSQCPTDRSCRSGVCPLDKSTMYSCFAGAGGDPAPLA